MSRRMPSRIRLPTHLPPSSVTVMRMEVASAAMSA
jgi:hypothetical protein